ncbi:MAG: DUF3579 domain-containing protein [Pseudomonadota bacterium]
MVKQAENCMVIHSVSEGGNRFRPSDWIERISASVARFGPDRRLRYNTQVHPVMINGEKCLFVSPELERSNPQLYHHIVAFAQTNRLQIEQEACRRKAA